MKQRGGAVIFIILALIATGLIGLFFNKQSDSTIINSSSPSETSSSTDWKTYTYPTGAFTLKYPAFLKITEGTNNYVRLVFPKQKSNNNQASIDMDQTENTFNRPLASFLKTDYDTTEEDLSGKEFTLGGMPAVRFIGRLGDGTEQIFVQHGNDIYQIRLYNYGDLDKNQQVFNDILNTVTSTPPKLDNSELKIVDGDIVVNGKAITTWGYNSEPTFSPDKSKVAFISTSKETLEYRKTDKGYKRFSSNVWVVNRDGSNPKQLTSHENFVVRSHLHWANSDQLIFLDGEETTRVYSTSVGTTKKIVGPDKAQAVCLDACGFVTHQEYSPNFTYLISLTEGYLDNKMRVANTKTQTGYEIENPYQKCIQYGSVKFAAENLLTFITSPNGEACDGPEKTVTLNLETKEFTIK